MSEVDVSNPQTTSLVTSLAGLTLPDPVLTASGCAGTGRELSAFFDVGKVAAFVTRSLSLAPRAGDPPPRAVESPSGLLTSVGLQGPGLQGFLATELPWLVQRGTRVFVSLAGSTLGEYAELARRLTNSPGVTGVEVNLACRNSESNGRPFGVDAYHAAKATAYVRRDSAPGTPVLVKLIPDVHDVVDVARAVVDAGADVVVLLHGPRGMAIDTATMRPALGAGTGELSGPAILPLAVRCVWEVHQAMPEVPLVGVGGIRTGIDALALLLAGATAVQVGSAIMSDPSAPTRVVRELRAELASRDIPSVADLIGRAHRTEGEVA
ncbi:MAG: dihydroorotate dehydrogenase [Actinomycetota bacterium]|nr:dihydroorotate dehydrogenase [Actinomycetota bacterium]